MRGAGARAPLLLTLALLLALSRAARSLPYGARHTKRKRIALFLLFLSRATPACVPGLAAALEPPSPSCELNIAFGAASAPGEWPLAHAGLWLFTSRGNVSSWQVVWTLEEADALLGDTVTGALLINPGGRAHAHPHSLAALRLRLSCARACDPNTRNAVVLSFLRLCAQRAGSRAAW
jgi:hypothetical protein